MQLPTDLRTRLEALCSALPVKALQAADEAVRVRYRGDRGKLSNEQLQIQNEAEAIAYCATRFPATYGVAIKAAQEMTLQAPVTLLDIGAGPATATLALASMFDITHATLLEPNNHLRACGEKLLEVLPHNWVPHTFEQYKVDTQFDIVVASYMFNEAKSDFAKLWALTKQYLLIIEPGTPHGFSIIYTLREEARKQNISIIGPCSHTQACPLFTLNRWCHFSVRIDRTKLHRAIKDADLNYEDEKFSYLLLSKAPIVQEKYDRLIGHPRGTKLIEAELCTAEGRIEMAKIPKSHPKHKQFRKSAWGDRVNY
ncbi:MAG: hypothetical protein GC136_08395 [Alphaproteobacteria bacterium]|nr:hypothetical protein [Alphaproteobacteria bacterium]